MGRAVLDVTLKEKIAKKLGKRKLSDVNVMVSKRAAKLLISAEAALIIIAKEIGIGTANYQRKLDAAKQAEVRSALPNIVGQSPRESKSAGKLRAPPMEKGRSKPSLKSNLKFMIEYLIQDVELRARCQDILLGSSKFDRAVNQATLVLEDRIRNRSQPEKAMVGDGLVGYSFNEEISKSLLRVASGNSDDQRGFTQILRGVVPAFRHKTHHHLIDSYSREEALCVCGFIDTLLRVVDTAVKTK